MSSHVYNTDPGPLASRGPGNETIPYAAVPYNSQQGHVPSCARMHVNQVQLISLAFEHYVFACGNAWLYLATNSFTDKYGTKGHTLSMHSVLVREAFCREN